MKRTIGFVVGLVTLGAVAWVGSQLWAQTPPAGGVRPASATAPAPSANRSHVAVFNLKFVVTNYWRWKQMQTQYEGELKVFEDKITPLKKRFDDLAAKVKDGKLVQADREAAEKDMRALQRQMQDIDEEAKKTLSKKQSDMMVLLYNDVVAVVKKYAVSHDLDLVMHYNDGVNDVEINAPENIFRKINSGPCVPVYWTGSIDISGDLIQTLNAGQPAQPTTPAGTPTTGGAGAGATTTQPKPPGTNPH